MPIEQFTIILDETTHYICIHDSLHRVLHEMDNENNSEIARHVQIAQYDKKSKDFITFLGIASDDPMKISYLNKSRLAICTLKGHNEWETKGRYMAKPSTVIEKLFPGIYNDKMKEEFTVLYRHIINKKCSEKFKIDIVHGEIIRKYYWEVNYSKKTRGYSGSNLFQSCMMHEKCQDYMDIYVHNPDKIGMAVILDDEGKVRARCILWWPDGIRKEPKYHDRIYAASSELSRGMQAQLESAGFININDKNDIQPKEIYDITIFLKLGENDFDVFPYMDTMKYISGNRISNYKDNWRCLDDTEGNSLRDPEEEEEGPRCTICADDTNDGEIDGHVTTRESRYYNDYLCESHRLFSECLNSWVSTNESCHLYDSDVSVSSRAVTLYNGEYADRDDGDLVISWEGEYFIEGDEKFVEADGKWYNIESKEYKQLKENELSI